MPQRSSFTRSSPRAEAEGSVGAIVLLATGFAILAFLVHELYSLDVWWQVAIGRDIIRTSAIPFVDRFAVAALGQPYHDSHWLFQVVLAAADRLFGIVGAQFVMVALWGLALLLCHRSIRAWVPGVPGAILLFLAAMASMERFLPRPEVVTFVGISTFYWALQVKSYRTVRGLALLCTMQALWANSHGLFVIGPFMVGCYFVDALVSRVRGRESELAAIGRALGGVALASLLTPYGVSGWRYAALLFLETGPTRPQVMRELGELSSSFGVAARSAPAFWFYAVLLLLAAAAAVRTLGRRELGPRWLIVAGLCAASFLGRRNYVLFGLVAAPLVAEVFADAACAHAKRMRLAGITAAIAIALWAGFPLSGAYYVMMEIPARWGLGATPSFFPHELPAFLDRLGFQGNVLNSNTLGGFYLYHGHPDRLPLTDGRWETYGPNELQDTLRMTRSPGLWRNVVDRYELEGVLLAHTSPEATAQLPELSRSPDWRLVYLDAAASFWLPEDFPALPPAIDPLSMTELPEIGRPDDGIILNAFFAGVGAPAQQVRNLERTLDFGVRKEFLLEQLGVGQLRLGALDDAQESFQALLDLDPRNAVALNELAYLAFSRGDSGRALRLMERLLQIDGDNPQYRENYQRILETLDRGRESGS
jgi:hypothetical protein